MSQGVLLVSLVEIGLQTYMLVLVSTSWIMSRSLVVSCNIFTCNVFMNYDANINERHQTRFSIHISIQ